MKIVDFKKTIVIFIMLSLMWVWEGRTNPEGGIENPFKIEEEKALYEDYSFPQREFPGEKIEDMMPKYIQGEVLVGIKDGADLGNILKETDITVNHYERLHTIKPTVAAFKKTQELEKDSDGWYWFLGKKYKDINNISDEEMFRQSYEKMSEIEKAVYRCYTVKFDEKQSVSKVIEKLQQCQQVEYAEPNYMLELMNSADNPTDFFEAAGGSFSEEFFISNWNLIQINCPQAWEITKGARFCVVAVIDSGVDYNHTYLQGAFWKNYGEVPDNGKDDDNNGYIDDVMGWDFGCGDNNPMDSFGHGTNVSGVIFKVAPMVRIMSVKVGSDGKNAPIKNLAEAIKYAVDNGANVLNLSHGEKNSCSDAIKEAIAYAYEKNCIIVAAAGNDNSNADDYFPAALSEVISVASVNSDNSKSSFSNYGTTIDVAAPGTNIHTTAIGNKMSIVNGTSFSAPHVSAVAALIFSRFSVDITNKGVMEQIRRTAKDIGSSGFDTATGYGLIDAYKAVTEVAFKVTLDIKPIKVGNKVKIYGTVCGGINHYEVYCNSVYPYSGNGSQYLTVYDNTAEVINGYIGEVDTLSMEEGNYTFEIVAYSDWLTHSIFEFSLPFFVDNLIEKQVLIGGEVGKKSEGPLIVDLEDDKEKEIILTKSKDSIIVLNKEGNPKEGWKELNIPQEGYGNISRWPNPAVADIDKDGIKEIITRTSQMVYVFNKGYLSLQIPLSMEVSEEVNILHSPVIEDINNDGNKEILITGKHYLYVFNNDGSLLSGWPQQIATDGREIFTMPAVGDIDGDGKFMEIVIEESQKELYEYSGHFAQYTVYDDGKIYILHHDGEIVSGWPQNTRSMVSCHPVLADLDWDGDLEIIAGGYLVKAGMHAPRYLGNVFVWHHNGVSMQGFPAETGLYPSGFAVADLNKDKKLEIIVSTYEKQLSYDDLGNIYTFNIQGEPFWFGTYYDNYINLSTPIVADINGDEEVEVIVTAREDNITSERIFAFDKEGEKILDLIRNSEEAISVIPAVGDLEGGNLELVAISEEGNLFIWGMEGEEKSTSMLWTMKQYNSQYTGCTKSGYIVKYPKEVGIKDNTAEFDVEVTYDGQPVEGVKVQCESNFIASGNSYITNEAGKVHVVITFTEALETITVGLSFELQGIAILSQGEHDISFKAGMIPQITDTTMAIQNKKSVKFSAEVKLDYPGIKKVSVKVWEGKNVAVYNMKKVENTNIYRAALKKEVSLESISYSIIVEDALGNKTITEKKKITIKDNK